ncbi:translationally-controlled tumor protein homolog isoform X1 [Lampris incognitus]|uniref:translationally-controlled tumor protein homolog isoform X1 n=2 Tax=Lampris incognitus TaxID=2546036 RepID=UPI0024B588A8|nr:translationally-controlled tumor protein homolog isoform X1 [Lampris incognitus]
MIIYKDIVTGDEMFSDIYKVKESSNGILFEVEGKMVSRTDELDESLFGSNASAEEQTEACEGATVSGVDIVLNHKLQETAFTKQSYKTYIKEYMKLIKTTLEEKNPERVQPFVKGAPDEIKNIIANFANYQFFTGESMNPEGMIGLLDYRPDGTTPYMIFFKDGLEVEKC